MDTLERLKASLRIGAKVCRDMEMAYSLLSGLTREPDSKEARLCSEAFFSSAIICYARSFTDVRGGITYPVKRLKRHEGFDLEIHGHLVEMRNKIIAHADEDAFPVDLYSQLFPMETDIKQAFVCAKVAFVRGFGKFNDTIFLERILRHIEACGDEALRNFLQDSRELMALENTAELAAERAVALDFTPDDDDVSIAAGTGPNDPGFYVELPMQLDPFDGPKIPLADEYTFLTYPVQASVETITYSNSRGEETTLEVNARLVSGEDK